MGRRVAAKQIHTWCLGCRAMRTFRTHAETVQRRKHDASHHVEGIYATQWIASCHGSSGLVCRQIDDNALFRCVRLLRAKTWVAVIKTIALCWCQARIGWICAPTPIQVQRKARVPFTGGKRQKYRYPIEDPAAENHVSNAPSDLSCTGYTTRHKMVILQERFLFCAEPNDMRDLRNIALHFHTAPAAVQILAFPQQFVNASSCFANILS